MTSLNYFFIEIVYLAIVSSSFFLIFSNTAYSQQVELISHEKMDLEGLHFWYENQEQPVALFNRNITPKGDCFKIVNDYIFFVWYKGGMKNRNLMLSRRKIDESKWTTIEFPDKNKLYNRTYRGIDYSKSPGGNSYRIATVGVSTKDETIHLVYNNHSDAINYRVSKKNIAFASDERFKLSSFSTKKNYVKQGEILHNVTYPNFNLTNEGDLLLDYRIGGGKKGDVMMTHYDGNVWSSSYKVVNGRNTYQHYNFYGSIQYLNDRLYIGGSIKTKDPNHTIDQSFFFGSGGQLGTDTWSTTNNNTIEIPFDSMFPFRIVESSISNTSGNLLPTNFTVSKSGTIHFSTKTLNTEAIHYYKPLGIENFLAGEKVNSISFAAGHRIYTIEQIKGSIVVKSTNENASRWRTDFTYAPEVKFDLFSYKFYKGRLYIIANEKNESDRRPLHFIIMDLGIPDTSLITSKTTTFSAKKTDASVLITKNEMIERNTQKTMLYPIPAIEELFIEKSNDKPSLLQIYTVEGKKIRSIVTDQKKLKISLQNYTSGTYILKIKSEDASETLRFIKN